MELALKAIPEEDIWPPPKLTERQLRAKAAAIASEFKDPLAMAELWQVFPRHMPVIVVGAARNEQDRAKMAFLHQPSGSITPEEFATGQLENGMPLVDLALALRDSMHVVDGIGLAAVQIGIHKRVLVVEINEKKADTEPKPRWPERKSFDCLVMFNAEIVGWSEESEEFLEACRSYEGVEKWVRCSKLILVRYQDIRGTVHHQVFEDWTARAIHHEIRHTRGEDLESEDAVEVGDLPAKDSKLRDMLDGLFGNEVVDEALDMNGKMISADQALLLALSGESLAGLRHRGMSKNRKRPM